jgi:hypothetical protein
MSALPPKADIGRLQLDVCFVPIADMALFTRSHDQDGQAASRDLCEVETEFCFDLP